MGFCSPKPCGQVLKAQAACSSVTSATNWLCRSIGETVKSSKQKQQSTTITSTLYAHLYVAHWKLWASELWFQCACVLTDTVCEWELALSYCHCIIFIHTCVRCVEIVFSTNQFYLHIFIMQKFSHSWTDNRKWNERHICRDKYCNECVHRCFDTIDIHFLLFVDMQN